MAKKDPRIDAYILKSKDFAKPVLIHIRELVHKTCPDVEEKMKWSFPHFDYKGEMMCSMAAFKEHCAFGFWKASLMKDAVKMKDGNEEAMGHYGRITSVKQLPPDKIIIANIKEAMKMNEEGIKLPAKKKTEIKDVVIPSDLMKALSKNKNAKLAFEKFSPSNKKEYAEWIQEAKTEDTKNKRINTAVEWISEGKSRNWKYMKK
jgi:uncharacterized protein YdeI (YjbR/CyaY-like superfamily)